MRASSPTSRAQPGIRQCRSVPGLSPFTPEVGCHQVRDILAEIDDHVCTPPQLLRWKRRCQGGPMPQGAALACSWVTTSAFFFLRTAKHMPKWPLNGVRFAFPGGHNILDFGSQAFDAGLAPCLRDLQTHRQRPFLANSQPPTCLLRHHGAVLNPLPLSTPRQCWSPSCQLLAKRCGARTPIWNKGSSRNAAESPQEYPAQAQRGRLPCCKARCP